MDSSKLNYLRGITTAYQGGSNSGQVRRDVEKIEAFSPEKFRTLDNSNSAAEKPNIVVNTPDTKVESWKICQDFVTLYQHMQECFSARTPEEYQQAEASYNNKEIWGFGELPAYDEGQVPEEGTIIPLAERNSYNAELLTGALETYTVLSLASIKDKAAQLGDTCEDGLSEMLGLIDEKAEKAETNGEGLDFSKEEKKALSAKSKQLLGEIGGQTGAVFELQTNAQKNIDYVEGLFKEFSTKTPGQLQTTNYLNDPFVKAVYKESLRYLKDHQKERPTNHENLDMLLIRRQQNLRD